MGSFQGVGHLAHVWINGVREAVSSNPDRGNIVGWVFHPTRWLARFSLIWICLSFQILNLFRTLSSWGSINYRPSAPLLYEVASHVKNGHSGQYYYYIEIISPRLFLKINQPLSAVKYSRLQLRELRYCLVKDIVLELIIWNSSRAILSIISTFKLLHHTMFTIPVG